MNVSQCIDIKMFHSGPQILIKELLGNHQSQKDSSLGDRGQLCVYVLAGTKMTE